MKLPPQKDGKTIYTKLVGVSFGGRQKNLREGPFMKFGDRLWWKFEEGNQFDANAILVFKDEGMTKELGHLPASVAKQVRAAIDSGEKIGVYVKRATGLRPPKIMGLNVVVSVE